MEFVGIVHEILEKDRVPGCIQQVAPVDFGFDGSHDDEKKPAEGEAHVHVTQERVDFENLAVKEAFEEYFFEDSEYFPAEDSLSDFPPVFHRQMLDPVVSLGDKDNQQRIKPDGKRKHEYIKVVHCALFF
jgi:hypothetical protein